MFLLQGWHNASPAGGALISGKNIGASTTVNSILIIT